jgi:mRNA interferase MazF
MKCKRGDVVLVLFPDSNLRTSKRRPALVIQADGLNTGLDQTIVAMISSNMSRGNHPCRISVSLGSTQARGSGLKTNSVIMTDNIATVREIEIDRVIGSWAQMAEVEQAIRHTFSL